MAMTQISTTLMVFLSRLSGRKKEKVRHCINPKTRFNTGLALSLAIYDWRDNLGNLGYRGTPERSGWKVMKLQPLVRGLIKLLAISASTLSAVDVSEHAM